MSYLSTILADSPVSVWLLDEASGTAAADSAGSNAGTYTGGFTLGGAGPSAAFGGSAAFNGSTGYVTVPDAANLKITGAITLECWVKFVALSSGSTNFGVFIAKRDSTGSVNGYQWLMHSNDAGPYTNRPFLGLIKAGVEKDSGTTGLPAAFVTGQWYHVVATYDNVDTFKTYLNGVLAQTTTGIGANVLGASTAALTMGNFTVSGVTGFLNGSLAGCAVYNTALSASRVAAHYWAGLAQTVYPDGSAVNSTNASASSLAVSLTTLQANNLIEVAVHIPVNTISVSSVTAAGLTFALRKAVNNSTAGQTSRHERWWAPAAAALSATSITVTLSGASASGFAVAACGVYGMDAINQYDPNASIPTSATADNAANISLTGLSTNLTPDLLLASMGQNLSANQNNPASGFNTIIGNAAAPSIAFEYKYVTATQSNLTISRVTGLSGAVYVVDALTAGTIKNRVSQEGFAVIGSGNPKGRVSHEGSVVIGTANPKGRVSQEGFLAVRSLDSTQERVSQVGLLAVVQIPRKSVRGASQAFLLSQL